MANPLNSPNALTHGDEDEPSAPKGPKQHRRCCSLQGIFFEVAFTVNIQWTVLAASVWAWVKKVPSQILRLFTSWPTSSFTSLLFFLLPLLIIAACYNSSYSSSVSSCLWWKGAQDLCELQIPRLGVLLNGTTSSASRLADLKDAGLGISELRSLVTASKIDSLADGRLDELLAQYANDLSTIAGKLQRVDSGLNSLVQSAIAHNLAAYQHLEASSQAAWLRRGPSFDVSYRQMLQVEDAIARALNSSLGDALALKHSVTGVQNTTLLLHQHSIVRKLAHSLKAGQTVVEALPLLWDAVVPSRNVHNVFKPDHRRFLAGTRSCLGGVLGYAVATHDMLAGLASEMRLIQRNLESRRDQSTAWAVVWRPWRGQNSCPEEVERGARAFEPLLLATDNLRTMLAELH